MQRPRIQAVEVVPDRALRGSLAYLLASSGGVDRSTVASSLADLEHDGAVVRKRDFADGRMLRAAPTEVGRALAEEGAQAVARAEGEALKPLRQRERERLAELLARALPQPSLPWWLRQG